MLIVAQPKNGQVPAQQNIFTWIQTSPSINVGRIQVLNELLWRQIEIFYYFLITFRESYPEINSGLKQAKLSIPKESPVVLQSAQGEHMAPLMKSLILFNPKLEQGMGIRN